MKKFLPFESYIIPNLLDRLNEKNEKMILVDTLLLEKQGPIDKNFDIFTYVFNAFINSSGSQPTTETLRMPGKIEIMKLIWNYNIQNCDRGPEKVDCNCANERYVKPVVFVIEIQIVCCQKYSITVSIFSISSRYWFK